MPAKARAIRLLAIIEASTITGPAKNLLQFARTVQPPGGEPRCNVHVAVFQRSGAPTLFLETARQLSIPVHAIPEKGRFDRAVGARLEALVRELSPDIVQTHAVKSHFLVRSAGIGRRTPWIAFHHGYTQTNLRDSAYNQLDRWSLRAARRVITVSEPFREEVIRRGVAADRIPVVHNAIDPEWGAAGRIPETRAEMRRRLGIPPAAAVILLVGRMSREKDHLTLLAAVARLRASSVPRAHVLLVGDGPERGRIQAFAAEQGLEAAVTFTGQVPSAEPYYGAADIAALSSLSEGSPNALLEAMAAGVPAVATRVGGIPEIVRDGESALLVAPRDAAAMEKALGSIACDDRLARDLASAARELVRVRHTPEARAERLLEIYSEVL
jgi:glycosyltransferase involved in cell wall biosynthesis